MYGRMLKEKVDVERRLMSTFDKILIRSRCWLVSTGHLEGKQSFNSRWLREQNEKFILYIIS